MDPDSARTHYNLGVLLWRIGGRKPEALAHFDAALRLRPDPELRRLADRLRAAQP
jgi:tetratricopeptide (TPR) repeat protein